MTYYGQYRQDQYMNENFFKGRRVNKDGKPLLFLEAGADDGISLSNTYFYEKELGWKGLLFEPNSDMYLEAVKIRNVPVLNIALSNQNGVAQFRRNKGYTRSLSGLVETHDPAYTGEQGRIMSEIREHGGATEVVDVVTLNNVLEMYGYNEFEFMSLDTEGSELLILENFDFDKYLIKIFTMENNFNEPRHREFMASKGYRLHTKIHIDDVYIKIDCEYDV